MTRIVVVVVVVVEVYYNDGTSTKNFLVMTCTSIYTFRKNLTLQFE